MTAEHKHEIDAATFVSMAFDRYLDTVVDVLVTNGVDSDSAIEAVFTAATLLEEEGVLPRFPERSSAIKKARWLVAAKDAGFLEFVGEAVLGG